MDGHSTYRIQFLWEQIALAVSRVGKVGEKCQFDDYFSGRVFCISKKLVVGCMDWNLRLTTSQLRILGNLTPS